MKLGIVTELQQRTGHVLMFDEALDALGQEAPFDLAFLDGQHEGDALRHYTQRLTALVGHGGVIVLDDIYWSRDMNATWRSLVDDGPFNATVDLGELGIGMLSGTPRGHHDFARLIGRPRIPPRVGD